MLELSLMLAAAVGILTGPFLFTAVVCTVVVAIPGALLALTARAAWHHTPQPVREWLCDPRARRGRGPSPESSDGWWERFERDYWAYVAAEARRRDDGPGKRRPPQD